MLFFIVKVSRAEKGDPWGRKFELLEHLPRHIGKILFHCGSSPSALCDGFWKWIWGLLILADWVKLVWNKTTGLEFDWKPLRPTIDAFFPIHKVLVTTFQEVFRKIRLRRIKCHEFSLIITILSECLLIPRIINRFELSNYRTQRWCVATSIPAVETTLGTNKVEVLKYGSWNLIKMATSTYLLQGLQHSLVPRKPFVDGFKNDYL